MKVLEIGSWCIYPSHGVGRVTGIREKLGRRFYLIESSSMNLLIPVDTAAKCGLRPIIDSASVPKVFEELRIQTMPDNSSWNRRYREYMELLKSGSIMDIASVARDLTRLRRSKDLSFGERKMLDHALEQLSTELSLAWGRHVDEAREAILEAI